ncbi:MAG TPA: tetratricopeptide repeat protein [Drouetiella sp.]
MNKKFEALAIAAIVNIALTSSAPSMAAYYSNLKESTFVTSTVQAFENLSHNSAQATPTLDQSATSVPTLGGNLSLHATPENGELLSSLSAASTNRSLSLASFSSRDLNQLTQNLAASVQTSDCDLMDTVNAFLVKGDIKSASDAVEKALASNPSNAAAYLCRAWVLYADYQDCNKVLAAIDQAIAIAPNYIDARISRAILLTDMNDWRAAAKEYDAVLSLDKTNKYAMKKGIILKTTLHDYAGLMTNFNIQIELDPNDAVAFYNRASCEVSLNQKDKAIADYTQAQKLFLAANDQTNAKMAQDALDGVKNA